MTQELMTEAVQLRARALRRTVVLLAVLIAAPAALASAGQASPTAAPSAEGVVLSLPPKPIDDFELTDQDARPFRLSQLKGRPALLFFGYTHCPDVCPATLAQLGLLMRSSDEALRGVALVMISVDGDRDRPGTLKVYLAHVLPRCIGLTGDPRTVRRINALFSGVFFRALPDRPGGDYLIEHTAQVYLIDSEGRLRATFFNASLEAIRQATAAIAHEPPRPAAPSP